MKKNIIFTVNQIVKKSSFDVARIAAEADMTEGQLRIYMNGRTAPLEKYYALIEAFTKLGEIELSEQLIRKFVGNDWCFYYMGKNKNTEINPNKISRELSVLLGNINKIIEQLGELDNYEKMHIAIDIQKMISCLLDLLKLIDRENKFLKLWT